MLRIVKSFIEQNHLFSKGDKVLIALSGGSDSVALMMILHELGYDCVAAHCNFHLRGDESDRDESFVRSLTDSFHVPLEVIHFDTGKYAADNKMSIEMAARRLRYDWFESIREKSNLSGIAVAHHRDDSIETMMLNLIRGTGITGLCGIRPRNGYVVRPLLCVSRAQIIEYLDSKGQTFVTDSSNLQDEFVRNKIRLRLLPLMEEINPAVKEGMQRTGFYLSEVERFYHFAIDEAIQRVQKGRIIQIPAVKAESSPYALLYELFYPLGFNSTQIEEMYHSMDAQSGKIFISPYYRVVKDRNQFIIDDNRQLEKDIPFFQLDYREVPYNQDFVISRSPDKVCLDADKISGDLFLRKWRRGDRFYPFGMKGQKLVSDFLTDLKLSLSQKEQQWLLCCGSEIVWLIGRRIDNRFRVDVHTRRVLIVEIREK